MKPKKWSRKFVADRNSNRPLCGTAECTKRPRMCSRPSNIRSTFHLSVYICIIILCNIYYISCQQQFFKVKPHDKYVNEGKEEVEFECHVGNLRGQVQWSKDGFLLGYDADIPGFSRYTMYVDTKNGVYNLRIKNVRLEDEGDYQCQVSPGPDNNQPIRAGAKLFVIIPPTKLIITAHYSNSLLPIEAKSYGHHHHASPSSSSSSASSPHHSPSYNNNRNWRQISANEGEMITLKCRTSSPTIPVTNLLWFHNGDIIRQGVRERVIERDSDFVDDSGGPSLLMTEAIIEVYSKLEEEGSSYKCRANHSGLGDRKLSEEIRLSILYGPGRPEVSGYSKGSDLKAGEKLTLSCLAKGGNPLPSLNWYLEDQLVDSTYSSPKEASSSGETVNGYTFTLKPEDNRRKVRCEASNSMGTQSSDLVLSVHFAPVHIKITGPVAGRINDILRYECLIGPSNPRPSEINWLINGVQYYDGQYPIESWSEETSYGHMSRTNITILLSETIKTVSCIATSPVSQFTASQASVNLNILYPPGEPTISGYTKGKELREGEVLRLKCSSLGGYPIPTIKWLKFIPQSRDEKEIAGLEGKAGHSGATSELLVRVASSDNGATYKCLVFNEVISQPLVTSVVLYPTYFASDYIKVKPTDSVKVRAISPADNVTLSTDVHLECESGECYPYCNMTWYRNGYKMATGAVGDGQEFEEKLSRSTGNFGGQKSLSRLTVKRKWTPYDDGSSFTCAASNMFLPMKKISKSISLHVQYNKSEFSMSNKLYGTKTIGTDLQEDLGPPMTISDATGGDSSHLPLDDSEKKDGAGDSFAFFMPLSSLLLFSLAGWLICFALAMSIVIGRVIKKRKLQVDSQASSSSTTPAKVHAEYEVTATVNGTSRPASICVTTDADGTTTTSSTCKCVIANGDVLGLPTVIQVADGYGLQSPMDMVTSGHVQVVTADAVEGHVTCIDGYCNGNITWYQEGYKVT